MAELYVPRATDWIGAFEAGQQARMADEKAQAGRRIGGLMASGDYRGAANAAYGTGDYKTGSALEAAGSERAAAARRQDYGAKLAAGQGADAVNAAYTSGDFEIAGDLQKALDAATAQQKAAAHEKASRVAEIVAPLGEIPETDIAARRAYIAQHHADLLAAGYTEPQIASFDPTNANLAVIYTQAMGLKDYLERTAPKVVGQSLVRPNGEVVYRDPQYKTVGDSLVEIGGSGPGQRQPAAAQPGAQGGPGAGGFDAIYGGFVAPHEGGFTSADGNGAPANFGINQKANPDVNVADLTPESARQIMHDRYWVPSGADKLPPDLQAIQFDTAVNMGVGAAQSLLQQSGSDPAKYLALREQRFRQIAQNDPSKAGRLDGWLSRNRDLAQYVQGGASPTAQAPAMPAGARVIAQAPAKPQARPATAEEKAAYGIPADVPAQMKPDGTIDTISVGNGRGSGKLAPTDAKYLSEARTSAQQLNTVVPSVKRFMDLNRQVGTGAGFAIPGVSMVGRIDPRIAEMQSITDKLTPAMRQGLPGAASDRDIAMFQSATVGLNKPGDANQSVANAIIAGAKRQQDYVAFLENFAKTNGSLLGAQEEWDAYAAANPMFEDSGKGSLRINKTTPWREYFGVSAAKAAKPAGAKPGPTPAKKPAHQMTDAEIKAALGI